MHSHVLVDCAFPLHVLSYFLLHSTGPCARMAVVQLRLSCFSLTGTVVAAYDSYLRSVHCFQQMLNRFVTDACLGKSPGMQFEVIGSLRFGQFSCSIDELLSLVTTCSTPQVNVDHSEYYSVFAVDPCHSLRTGSCGSDWTVRKLKSCIRLARTFYSVRAFAQVCLIVAIRLLDVRAIPVILA